MPANLPPAYYEAERKYRQAKSGPEKVTALQDMISATPKHKGTDHLRADQRSRLARLMDELEKPSATSSGQPQPFAIKKEGAGQAVLVGLPNVGKSQLVASLTGAAARVASYPFTTQLPLPGMLPFQNIRIQLVDTPAINDRDMQTRLFSLLRNTDLLLVTIDLSCDALAQMEEVVAELEAWGYKLLGSGETPSSEDLRVQKPVVLVANKADETGALDQFQALDARYAPYFPVLMVSTLESVGLEELKEAVFDALQVVRVYTKAPNLAPTYETPIVLPEGSTVEAAAQALHKDWWHKLKYALLWGSGKFDGQRVGRDYVLHDEDVLEFH